MIYHAYGFPCTGYNVAHVRSVIEWARAHGREVRAWVCDLSGLLVLAVADPDTSENSGSDLYAHVKRHAPSYECYDLASRFEFEQGALVPAGAALVEADKLLLSNGGQHNTPLELWGI